jgi:hypothetical protein
VSNFEVGDFITINAPTHPDWHGKKGTIRRQGATGFITAVIGEHGKDLLVELLPSQMIKVVREPGLSKLLGETLPALTKQAVTDHNANQEKVVDEANRDIRVFKAGIQEGYVNGYRQGYVDGYQAAMVDVQALFVANGLIAPNSGNSNATPKS